MPNKRKHELAAEVVAESREVQITTATSEKMKSRGYDPAQALLEVQERMSKLQGAIDGMKEDPDTLIEGVKQDMRGMEVQIKIANQLNDMNMRELDVMLALKKADNRKKELENPDNSQKEFIVLPDFGKFSEEAPRSGE